jgi:CubicO group peptidase (beta-lactamase class C family)
MTLLFEAKALSPASIETMWTPEKLSDGSVCEYGFGWRVDRLNGRRLVGHTGGIEGFSTCVFCYPDEFIAVVVLSNHEEGAVFAIARQLAELYVSSL